MLNYKIMRNRIILFFGLASVLSLNIYFRTFPIYFPQLKIQAKNKVEQKINQEAVKELDKKFPEFSPLAKYKLIKDFISDYHQQKKQEIKKEIQEEYLKLKDKYQDETAQTYLMELDCWHWGRYVDNVVRLGHPGDKVINGRQWDNLMLAPSGILMGRNWFLFYLSGFLYKAFSLLKPIPVYTFTFYLPLLFISIFIIALYLFCFYYWGNLAAITSCMFIGLAPIFLDRSCAGWFDMDILNLLFPVLIIWAYLISYNSLTFKRRMLWIFLSSFLMGLFCFTWIGWWFVLIIIIFYEIYSLANLLKFKQHLLSLFFFLLFSFLWIGVFTGFFTLESLYSQIKNALTLNTSLTNSLWPNTFATVSELRKADFFEIVNSTGGVFLFVPSLACLVALFLRIALDRKQAAVKKELIIILVIWFISMFFACFKGIRFSMFLLIPLGIALGWYINDAYEFFMVQESIKHFPIPLRKSLKVIAEGDFLGRKNKKRIAFLVTIIMVILSTFSINNALDRAKSTFPLMDDKWHKILATLKENTSSGAVINSWWDFGDWFKAVSRRRVIFDGQSQNLPQSYWMGYALMTDNEIEAIGILRMLNNAGNKAFELVNGHLKDPFASVFLLKKIISQAPEKAREILLQVLPVQTAEEAMKLIFGKPGEAYFIVDYTMADKMPSISFLGNWDFVKFYLTQNLNKKDKALDYLVKLDMDKQQVERFFQEAQLVSAENLGRWVSHKLRFRSELLKGEDKDGVILFAHGLVYNPKQKTIYLYSSDGDRYKIPKSIFLFSQDKMEEIIYSGNDLDLSALVFKASEGYRAVLLDRELANSMFVRLYFLGGAGLKYFKPFREEKENGNYIRVFKINWS